MSHLNQRYSDVIPRSKFSGPSENGFGPARFYTGHPHDSISSLYTSSRYTDSKPFHSIKPRSNDANNEGSRDSSKNEKQNAFARIFNRFADKTSMQGVNYIASSKLIKAKLFWIFLTFVAIVVSILHMYLLIDVYAKYPKQTKLTLGFNPLKMPAVTICNVNPIKKSKLDMLPEGLRDLMEQLDPDALREKRVQSGGEGGSKGRGIFDIEFNETYDDYDSLDEPYDEYDEEEIGPRDMYAETFNEFREYFGSMDSGDRFEAGHDLDDMMIRCSIKGRKCDPANFTLSSSMNYGNCYTLQSDKYILDKSGPDGGMTIVLYLESYEYIEGFSSGYGVRVVIHELNTTAFPFEQGFYVSAGTETNIGMQMRDIHRLGDPFGKCETGEAFRKHYGIQYTRQACQYFCKVTVIWNACKCYRRDEDDLLRKMNILKDKKWCSTKAEMGCMYKTENLNTGENLTCDCLNPCRERDFTKSVSAINWPSYKYAQLLTEFVCDDAGKDSDTCQALDGIRDDKALLRENFLKINIYYESLNFEKIEEEQDYEDIQFISDVGGAIGLWVGLSMLSIFELGQLLVELLHQLMYKQSCGYRSPETR